MVDHDDFIQATYNTDILDAAGWVIGGFAELPYDIAIEHMVHEGTLSRTGDAGDGAEDAEWEGDTDILQIMLASALNDDGGVLLEAATFLRHGDRLATGEVVEGERAFGPIGLRGAGKSSLGERLADASALPFVELNDVIERESGLPVSDVIALYGPDGYRGFERSALQSVVDRQAPLVLAVAGGIVDAPDTYDLLLSEFHTIWLQAAPEEHMNRVIAQGDERPMAGNPRAMEELKTILQRRESAYARAHGTLNTSGCSPAESASDLLKLIRDKAAFIE